MKRIQKIGSNRGLPRIWIEGAALAAMGWHRGTRFTCEFHNSRIIYARCESGSRAVAGDDKRPIIDTNNSAIHTSLGEDTRWISVEISAETITITPSAAPPSKLGSALAAAAIFASVFGAPWIARASKARRNP
jgi:hypothetical protein